MDTETDELLRVPHDIAAEQALLGACMWDSAAIDSARTTGLTHASFYRPAHQFMWWALISLHAQDAPTDPIAVRAELERRNTLGDLTNWGGPPYLIQLYETAITGAPGQAAHFAGIVVRHARARTTLELATQLQQIATSGDPDFDKAREYVDHWTTGTQAAADTAPIELDDFLDQADDETRDWVIPGLLERHDRLILTGPEGGGKSTLCRQIAVQAASGLHPFTSDTYTPQRVLIVDLENSPDQTRRELRPLRVKAGGHYQRGNLHIEVRADGIDLTGAADRDWLTALARAIQPDLIYLGPLYKAANGDPTEEKSSKPVALALDRIRIDVGCALLLEAHSSKAMHGTKRAIEPYGWSGWLRWPEFGVHLSAEGEIRNWRGHRSHREWPGALARGGPWPWTAVEDESELRWIRIKKARTEFGETMTERDVVEATGIPKTTVHRLLARRSHEWEAINSEQNGIAS